MPLRVTVEVIPNGDEARAEVLDVVTITNEGPTSQAQAKDPGGHRTYRVVGSGGTLFVAHRRSDGALMLAGRAVLHMSGMARPRDPNQEELAL
jgi:hypothetical protein